MEAIVGNDNFPSILTGWPWYRVTTTSSPGYIGIDKLLLARKDNMSRLGDLSICNSGTRVARSQTECTIATGKAPKRGDD